MGAYFQTQFITKQGERKTYYHTGLKFLESCYLDNYSHSHLYQMLENTPTRVFTVCDYDRGFSVEHLVGDYPIQYWCDEGLKLSYDHCYDYSGKYLVCLEKQQYVDLGKLHTSATDDLWVVSPLALLTRATNYCQGGGDLRDFPVATSSWYGRLITVQDTLPVDFKDITDDILVFEQ